MFAVFLSSVRNGWVNWDEADKFLGNPHFRGLGWSTIRWIFTGSVQDAHWIPFTWLTLSLDHAMWGMNPAGYHLTSLLIHSINALLCYVLAYRLLELGFGAGARPRDLRLAGAVAALFFAAALLSKVMVVGLPILLVVLDVYPLRRLRAGEGRWPTSLLRLAIPALRAQFLFHLGMVDQRASRPDDAEARFREAMRLDPELPPAWIRLGVIL